MPRYNVEYKNKWACFSSISDGFITKFMPKDEYEAWRKEQYGVQGTLSKAEDCNRKSMSECVDIIILQVATCPVLEALMDTGLSEDEANEAFDSRESNQLDEDKDILRKCLEVAENALNFYVSFSEKFIKSKFATIDSPAKLAIDEIKKLKGETP